MGCVNRNGKEFKTLAQKHSVSADNLELIVHKYWLETGSEENLPSDVYIQAQLGNMVYHEPISSVRKLWKQRYSSPLEFNTQEDLKTAIDEASKFFPPEAIFSYENDKGKYILSIKEPVARVTRGDDVVRVKKLNLNIEEGRAYSIDKVKELFDKFNTDRTSKHLAEKVFNVADRLGLNIRFIKGLGKVGGHYENGTIELNKSFFEDDIMNNRKASILLHELVHAVTTYALDSPVEGNKELQKFRKEINNIYYELRDRGALEGMYGMGNTHEFVAELANPLFRQKLQEYDKGSVWSRVVNAIKSFLGLHVSSPYYNRSMNALENALNAFDIDAYLKYNDLTDNLKNELRKDNVEFSKWDIAQRRQALKDYYMRVLNFTDKLPTELEEKLKQAEKAARQERKDLIYAQEGDDTGSVQRQLAESRRQNFENLYKGIINTVKIFKTKNGALGISATFKTYYELLREVNKDVLRQLDWIDSLSDEEVMSYTALLDQENSDYDLIYDSLGLDETSAITQEMQDIKSKAIADGTFMKAPNGKPTNLNERQWLQVRTKAFKRWFGDWEKIANFVASFTDKKNILTINENEYTDDFRRIQEESRRLSEEEIQLYHRGDKKYPDESRRALGAAYERLLSRRGSNVSEFRTLTGKGNTFNVSRVNGSLFHDIFEINRNYLQNGELVDLHDSYEECKCFLSDDGLCGFAIESDGNLVSVFSLNPKNKGGFLYAIKDFIAEQGATHLDAYASSKQNLEKIYEKTLGFHVASEMDYNMEYDHDNIAENHGMPKVVFMVNHEVERKAFDENSYDDASNYAKSNIKTPFAEVSKVVDENGEPLVVYHGTPNFGFNIFDVNAESLKDRTEQGIRKQIYFTKDRSVAEEFAVPNNIINALKLIKAENNEVNIEDYAPYLGLTVEQAETLLSKINNGEFDAVLGNYTNDVYEVFLNIKNPVILDANHKAVYQLSENDKNKIGTTDGTIVSNALESLNPNVLEGVAQFNKAADKSLQIPYTTDYLVSNPNQIKSATDNIGTFSRENDDIQMAMGETVKPASQMNNREVWDEVSNYAEPLGRRPITYTPVGKEQQTYTVQDGHIYNKEGKEVFKENSKDRNKILANLAITESRAVLVNHKDSQYVVDNNQNIISVTTGNVMKWGEENGDRRAILNAAVSKFRDVIAARQQRDKAVTPQLTDQLNEIGKEVGFNVKNRADIQRFIEDRGTDLVQLFIGKKSRAQFEQALHKARPDMSDAEIQSTLDFLHSLEDNKENTAYIKTAIRWVANRSITLPQDNTRTRQAFDVARKKHIDLQKYKTFEELITSDEMQPKEKEKATFNPDKAKTFSNKRTVITEGGREFTVYDVENTEEGQREVCKALAAHYEVSPWCLSTFTSTGEPTESAKRYWQQYNTLPRKIAYENGKPVAFNSNGHVNSAYYYNGEKLNLLNEEQMKPLEKLGLVESTPFGEFILTTKGEETFENRVEEAWWDLADVSPQKSLSDNIDARTSSVGTTIPFNDPFEVPEPYEPTNLEVARDHYLGDLIDGVQRIVDEVANELNVGQDYAVRNYVTEHYLRTMDFSVTEVTQEMANGNGEAIAALVDQHVNTAFKNHVRQTIRAYYTEAEEQRRDEDRRLAARPISPNWAYEALPFFKTSQGEVYGFVAPNDDVYLDETVISPEHPIHEYTHLWDRYVAKKNAEFWKQGVKIFKQTSLWKEIENDANYGQKWKAMKGMTTEKLESLIASEVHSRLVGKQGAELLDRIAKEKGTKNIIGKLKQWILDFWKELKSAFSNWSKEEIDDFFRVDDTQIIDDILNKMNQMVMRDFADKINFGTIEEEKQNTQKPEEFYTKQAALDYINDLVADGIDRNLISLVHTPETNATDEYWTVSVKQQQQNTSPSATTGLDVSKAEFYSGAAEGSDTFWANEARKLGIKVTEYTRSNWNTLSQEWKDRLSKEYVEVANALARPVIPLGGRGDVEVRRDMMQADKADAIFAIGTVVKPGQKGAKYINRSNSEVVDGGTGYAVQRGIIRGIPVYVFDQSEFKWKVWDKNSKSFVDAEEPTLTSHAAVIGTRGLSNEGKVAIKSILQKTIEEKQTQQQIQEQQAEPQFTKVNKDFADTLINHLRTDNLEGYESKMAREALVRMAEALFSYFDKNGIKIVITNHPYSEREKGESSAVTSTGKYAAIFYQDVPLQGGKYLNILHELLHIATNNAIPFDSMGRMIADEKLQGYYDLFKRELMKDPEWKDIQDLAVKRDKESFDKASDRAKILAHAYSSAGEFVSCAVSNKEVQQVLESITYGEVQTSNLFEELRNWFKEVLEKIFHGYSYISHANFLEDVTDFLMNTEFSDQLPIDFGTAEEEAQHQEYLKSLEDRYNNAKDFVNPDLHKQEEAKPAAQNTENNQQSSTEIQAENTTFTTQLPNYQRRYALMEVVVDAQWKIPVLQNLDNQVTNDMTDEEKEAIFEKMHEVMRAESQEEYLKANSKESQEIQKELDGYDRLINQINNLLDSDMISATEIRHVAELVINSISDDITEIQKDSSKVEEWFPMVSTDLDFKTATRRQIVDAIGIMNFFDRAKRNFDPETNTVEYEDLNDMDQAWLITDNWDAIIRLGSDVFAMNEGFGIEMNFSKGLYETTNESKIGSDNFNEYQDIQDIQEKVGDAQEYWQVEARTIDILNSMSELVRLALHQAYQLDKNGNKIISKWGIAERVNPRTAVNGILRWTQGARNLEDMVTKLSEKAKVRPWLNQIIERLNDKSGDEADFQSQFYNTFQKHFQKYTIVKKNDGSYYVMVANERPALKEAMQSISSQFAAGVHPLFSGRRIRRDMLGSEETVGPNAAFNLYKGRAEINKILHPYYEALRRKNGVLSEERRTKLEANNEIPEFTEQEKEIIKNNLIGITRILGYPVAEETINEVLTLFKVGEMMAGLGYVIDNLENQIKDPSKKPYDPFTTYAENSIRSDLQNFLKPLTDILEDDAITAFYDSGKMYQSYVTPSFTTKLMNKYHLPKTHQELMNFLKEEYGGSEWFVTHRKVKDRGELRRNNYNEIITEYRFGWMRKLQNKPQLMQVEGLLEHTVQLNFNKHNYMKNMNDDEYILSLISEYHFKKNPDEYGNHLVRYKIPMESNKPSSEFITFLGHLGKNEICNELYNLFLQEASRIQTVRMRNLSEGDPGYIKNWDKNGKKFNFLPFLNDYLEDTDAAKKNRTLLKNEDGTVSEDNAELARLIQEFIDAKHELSPEDGNKLITLTTAAIRSHMEERSERILADWKKRGIFEAAKNIENVAYVDSTGEKHDSDGYIESALEDYIWNQKYASINILQMFVGDIAFYKNTEDLQKRLAQLHSPGIRANVNATDYKGNPVSSDHKYRTVVIRDLEKFKSDLIANITEVFDRKIQQAPEGQKAQWEALKKRLVGKDGAYWKINVTDGQGYSSPTSYRKKAFMFGKWSRKSEEIYNKILKGEATLTEIQNAFQPMKPFVYTHLTKSTGVENAPIKSMYVPFQAKNSEYLLVMADALLRNEETSRPNLLRAIFNVMEDSAFDGRERDENGKIVKEGAYNGRGIDTVQFGSAIKSGLQTELDILPFADVENGEMLAYNHLMDNIYLKDDKGNRTSNYNVEEYVQEGSMDDYSMQQEVPEHFKDHDQAHGSQERMILPSDLEYLKDPTKGETEDNINYIEWTETDAKGKKIKRKVNTKEFSKEYEETIAANIERSINILMDELKLSDRYSKKERNIALSKLLQREILGSPRYGVDLLQACSIDKETGEFRIPKGDPVQSKRIEQLLNSIIKDRVNKQEIAGGPIVQVTNWGTSRQLHIRFKNNEGKVLLTEEEFNNKLKGEAVRIVYKDYKEYLQKEQNGIAYFEVFAPIWSKDLLEYFMDENGFIDAAAIEKVDPDLLKMISYRIPTEDKYSMAPMKVVGFMPREAGDAIMLPYELTGIDDSDFDVDKRYVMRKDLHIAVNTANIRNHLFEKAKEFYQQNNIAISNKDINEEINSFMDNPEFMKNADNSKGPAIQAYLYQEYTKFKRENPEKAFRTYQYSEKSVRDNKIIDMSWAVLTHEMSADKILNPGGFDDLKKVAYIVAAYKHPENTKTWEELEKLSTDELKDLSYVKKDLTWVDDEIQFYKQNAAGSNLIGVFAVNKVAHAIYERDGYFIAVDEIANTSEPFEIAGMVFNGKKKLDPGVDLKGRLIGKVLGSGVSASADTAKDPILDLIGINMTTAGMFTTLVRLGMPYEDASLLLSQNIVGRMMREFSKRSISGFTSLESLMDEFMTTFKKMKRMEPDEKLTGEDNLSREELIEGLRGGNDVVDYKVILALRRVKAISDTVRDFTFPTRLNSISSAVGPQIVDNLMLEYKWKKIEDRTTENSTYIYDKDGYNVDITDVFFDHPILGQFARGIDIARQVFSDMPAGSEGFRNILEWIDGSSGKNSNSFNPNSNLLNGLNKKLFGDRKLLSKFIDFYQSYLMTASGVADLSRIIDLGFNVSYNDENGNKITRQANLKEFMELYPKFFIENIQKKYPDNPFIQKISLRETRTDGVFLSINTTGMDQQEKERLSSGWIDFHKKDYKNSKLLFLYNFFKGGIAFNPKTFMSLVPTYVKERISYTLKDGKTVSYISTFRDLPVTEPEFVLDQFVANNWGDNKLVPWKGGKDAKFIYNFEKNTLTVNAKEELKDLKDTPYIKTSVNKVTYLWKRIVNTEGEMVFKKMGVLGNNGKYLEMQYLLKEKPIENTKKVEEVDQVSDREETSPAETAADTGGEPIENPTQQVKKLAELVDGIMLQNPKLTREEAEKVAERAKKSPGNMWGFLQNVFDKMGIKLEGKEAVKKEMEKYC